MEVARLTAERERYAERWSGYKSALVAIDAYLLDSPGDASFTELRTIVARKLEGIESRLASIDTSIDALKEQAITRKPALAAQMAVAENANLPEDVKKVVMDVLRREHDAL